MLYSWFMWCRVMYCHSLKLLSWCQTNDRVGQFRLPNFLECRPVIGQQFVYTQPCDIGSDLCSWYIQLHAEIHWPVKCTTSKLLTCRVTNGEPIRPAFYVVSQSQLQATSKRVCIYRLPFFVGTVVTSEWRVSWFNDFIHRFSQETTPTKVGQHIDRLTPALWWQMAVTINDLSCAVKRWTFWTPTVMMLIVVRSAMTWDCLMFVFFRFCAIKCHKLHLRII